MIRVAWPWLLVGCGGGSALDDCRDVACRSELVLAAWDEAPEAVMGMLNGLATDLERVAVVNAVVQARGEPAAGLCDLLEPNPHGQRCHRIASRPHLRQEGGLVGSMPVVQGGSGDCEPGVAGRACRALAAAEGARRGKLDEVRRWCVAEDATQWRQECHFQAAEAWMMEHGAGRMPGATSLCDASGDYRGECLRHVVLNVVRGSNGGSWHSAGQDAQAIRGAFETADPALGQALIDRFWAEMLANAWAGPRVGEGSPPELPLEALPHHRAGAAMRWLRDGATPTTLEEAVVELEDWMGREGLPVHRLGEPFPRVDDTWRDGNKTTTVSYLGASRRVTASSPRVDLEICILEAAARTPGLRSLLESGLKRPAVEVQETARRLLAYPSP